MGPSSARGPALGLALVTLVAPLSGCLGLAPAPMLDVLASTFDSMAAFHVDDVSPGFEYRDLDIVVNGEAYEMGPRMDHGQGWYAVEDKQSPAELVDLGDTIWLPGAGRLNIKFRHQPSGDVVAAAVLLLDDRTKPPPPALVGPSDGATVHRDAPGNGGDGGDGDGDRADRSRVRTPGPVLSWERVDDASGVTYVLHLVPEPTGRVLDGGPLATGGAGARSGGAGATGGAGDGGAQGLAYVGLASTNFTLPDPDAALLVPGQSYAWRVRAVDGLGQLGDWSPTWTLRVAP